MVWCRVEMRKEIQWAGAKDGAFDQTHGVMEDGSNAKVMGPRNSFEVFVELTANTCAIWQPSHVRYTHAPRSLLRVSR